MASFIEIVSSPHVVAHFQRLCGLEWKNPVPNEPIFPIQTKREGKENPVAVKSKFILRVMQIGSELAGESFYYTFLPVCSWILDIGVARKTLSSLALVMYIGQSAKDILRKKRPASPPVIRLEAKYETEYGMPSTHAMAGTVAPFALYSFTRMVYQIPESKCIILASIWTSWIAVSRIYLGMHTATQVFFGVAGAGSIFYYSRPYVNMFDTVLARSNYATAIVAASSVIFSWIIFKLDAGLDPETGYPRWNTARGDQVRLMGFTAGFLVGSKWAICQGLYMHRFMDQALIQIPSLKARDVIGKMIIGGLLILPMSVAVRNGAVMLFAKLNNIQLGDKITVERHPMVELPYKFLTNFVTGTLCSSFAPWVFNKLHIW